MSRPRNDGTAAQAPNKRKLTDLFVRNLKPTDRRRVVWDQKQAGLALIVQPTGARAWKYVYRFAGKPRWLTIGNANAIPLADARRLAAKAALRVIEGFDPQAERMAQRGVGTFEELALRYRNTYAKRHNKSWAASAFLIDRFVLPKWGKLAARDIKRADASALLATFDDRPALGNQVLAAISSIFSWAIKQEIVAVNPCRLVDRNKTKARERILSDSELPQFWREFSPALKLILLTGQRPGEVGHMRREDIVDGWWTLPGEPTGAWPGTKNGATHSVWLSEPVQALLDDRFFDGTNHSRLDNEMRDICRKLGVTTKVTPHDLRRTFSSKVTALGFGRDAMNRVTNHKDGGISDVYDRHGYADENKKIMETVARAIVTLAEGGTPENVVEFRSA